MALKRFLGPTTLAKHAWTDNPEEFIKAFKEVSILHDTSTPHRSETSRVIERSVCRVKEGASSSLVQSGLNEEWLDLASQCYVFLGNVVDHLICGNTALKKRFKEDLQGPIIRFGAQSFYKPSYEKDKNHLHKLGSKML